MANRSRAFKYFGTDAPRASRTSEAERFEASRDRNPDMYAVMDMVSAGKMSPDEAAKMIQAIVK